MFGSTESQVQNDSRDNSMQVAGDGNDEKIPPPASLTTHTRTIGIIYPPPDIRTIVDKTASCVAKNGPEFEKRIIASNAGNVNFNFLNGSDPYHAYYLHQLSEFRAQNQAHGQQSTQPSDAPDSESTLSAGTADGE